MENEETPMDTGRQEINRDPDKLALAFHNIMKQRGPAAEKEDLPSDYWIAFGQPDYCYFGPQCWWKEHYPENCWIVAIIPSKWDAYSGRSPK